MILRHPLIRSRRDWLEGAVWSLETPAGLATMFVLGLVVRLVMAPYLGFHGDLRLFQEWATRLNQVGTHHFYSPSVFADYPPGYLYVLSVIGKISATPSYLLLKLPTIVADLGLAWVAGTFATRLVPEGIARRVPVRALVAATVLFNPAVLALGAGWGQIDSIPAFFVLWSLLLLFTGSKTLQRELASFVLFAIAIAIKPQAGFVLPVMLYALYRRYLHQRPTPQFVDGALSIGLIGAPALALWAASGLAFGLGPVALVHFYQHSASVYPVTSANAFNFWGVVGFWKEDQTTKVLGVSALHLGMLAFLAVVVFVLWRVHKALERGANEARLYTAAAAVISLFAFVMLTRMHERYMFLALACFAPLVVARPARRWYAALCLLFVVNLWYPYAFFNAEWRVQALEPQPLFGWLFGGTGNDSWQRTVWSIAVTAVAAALSYVVMGWAEKPVRLDPASSSVSPAPPPTFAMPTRPALPTLELGLPALPNFEADDVEATAAPSRWPLALTGLAALFGLVFLRGQTSFAPAVNDSAFHLQMVQWASHQIHEGRVPLDGWYPWLSLGSSFFHHYQSLAETLTAYLAALIHAGDATTYVWLLYLLLALWPLSVYAGARLLGWSRWTAAAAAAVSLLVVSVPGYGFESDSYTWAGYGVYSQLWAMVLLPLAWGFSWRAVASGKRYAAAAVAIALTIAFHFICGYLAILTVGVWVIVLAGGGFLRHLGRAAIVGAGSILIALWVLVPLISDTTWTTRSAYYQGTFFNDSYGARKVLGWLFTGGLFDKGRFPIVTLLFFAGLIVCLLTARRDVRSRALLGAFTLSLFLFFGRPTWGSLLKVFPGFGDIQIHRFIMGVHLAGILIAGVGLAAILRAARAVVTRRVPGRYAVLAGVAAVALAVGVLTPAWTERARADNHDAALIRVQQATDATEGPALDRLVSIIKARGGGRVYAGLRANWGKDYLVGYVPVYAWLAYRDIDEIGFTFRTINSLSNDVEAAFEETNPAQYQMFDIRYLLLPVGHPPPVPAKLIASSGGNRLYQAETSGYFQVVDRSTAIDENRTDIELQSRAWRTSDLASHNVYPGVAFAGSAAPPPTFSGSSPPTGSPGTVLTQTERLQDGVFDATVRANRTSVVLLKASYDRRWTATVDGVRTKPVMMAPSLVGVEVPPGVHAVDFRYAPYGNYPLLFVIGFVTLLALVVLPGAARRGQLVVWSRPLVSVGRRFGVSPAPLIPMVRSGLARLASPDAAPRSSSRPVEVTVPYVSERLGLGAQRRGFGTFALAALVALLVVWLVVEKTQSSPPTTPTSTWTASSVPQLRSLVSSIGHWVWWVGPEKGYTYELTEASDGAVIVTYLPPGVSSSTNGSNLYVATYPALGTFGPIEALAHQAGHTSLQLPGGAGIGYYQSSFPNDVRVAYPGVDYQIEVFEPTGSPSALVTGGRLTPVPPK